MPQARDYFSKVKEAREAIKARAVDLLETYLGIIEEARSKGDFETAMKATQWLIEHMPNEDGVRVIDSSASKPKEEAKALQPVGPSIQIGIALTPPKTPLLAPAVIDIEPDKA